MRGRIVGIYDHDPEVWIANIDEKLYALCGWNGVEWTDCWEVQDVGGFFAAFPERDCRIILFSSYEKFCRGDVSWFEMILSPQ